MFRLARFSGSGCGQAAVHNNAEHWTKQNPDTCTNKPLAAMGRHRPPWACFLPVYPNACWSSRGRSACSDWAGLAAARMRWGKNPKRRWNTRLPTGVSSLVGVCSGRVCLMRAPAAGAGAVECAGKVRWGSDACTHSARNQCSGGDLHWRLQALGLVPAQPCGDQVSRVRGLTRT